MTLPNHDTVLSQFHDLLADHGFDGLADALTVLLNEVMKIERSRHLRSVGRHPGSPKCRRRSDKRKNRLKRQAVFRCNAPREIRTPVLALKGLRPSPLDDGGVLVAAGFYHSPPYRSSN